jgi:hypothetical protein
VLFWIREQQLMADKEMRNILLSFLIVVLPAGSAPAGNLIRNACLTADRAAASAKLCSCIQSVADQRLKQKDQKLAASFFRDPHKAQEIRQSDSHAHEVFWGKYKEFGAAAQKSCANSAG